MVNLSFDLKEMPDIIAVQYAQQRDKASKDAKAKKEAGQPNPLAEKSEARQPTVHFKNEAQNSTDPFKNDNQRPTSGDNDLN